MTITETTYPPFGKAFRKEFSLEDKYVPLNHGSFGVYPNALKPIFRGFQDRAEQNPDRWIRFEQKLLIRHNLERVAELISCDVNDIAFVLNASNGINTVLRSYPFKEGDKIIFPHTIYTNVDKTLQFLKHQYKVELIPVQLDYPLEDSEIVQLIREVIERENAKNDGRRIVLGIVDVLCSLPGVRLPFEAINQLYKENDILSLVDGAHAIGHIELNLTELDPDFFIANCHKWLYSPRGCAILYTKKCNQGLIHPTTINCAYEFHEDAGDQSTYALELFPGTVDTTPYMCISAALDYRKSIGGEEAIRTYCHDIAIKGGQVVADILGTQVMENSTKTLTANMSNIELPAFASSKTDSEIAGIFTQKLIYEHDTMAAVYKNNNKWWVRLCGQIYVDLDDFQKVGKALLTIIKELDEK